jgi:hypothetical protein
MENKDGIVNKWQFCTQCGTKNVDNAKFCKSCGYPLTEQDPSISSEQPEVYAEPVQKQESSVNEEENNLSMEHSEEVLSPWSGWLLLLPALGWVIYRLAVLAKGDIGLMIVTVFIPNIIAEILGGVVLIIGAPLIITSIIYFTKKTNNLKYIDFVKHTLIASILMLAFAIASNVHAIHDEEKTQPVEANVTALEVNTTTSAIPTADTDATMPADYAAAPAVEAVKDDKINSPQSVNAIQTVINVMNSNNKRQIAKIIEYPFCFQVGCIYSEDEFVTRFNEVFDQKIIKEITQSNINSNWDEMGDKGIMLNAGQVWINNEGHIIAVNYGTELGKKIVARNHNLEAKSMHSSVAKFQDNILEWKTKSYHIRVDTLGDGNPRYVAWSSNQKRSEKPNIVLNAKEDWQGTGGNRLFIAKNGRYRYEVYLAPLGDPTCERTLTVYKDDQPILTENATLYCDLADSNGCEAFKN